MTESICAECGSNLVWLQTIHARKTLCLLCAVQVERRALTRLREDIENSEGDPVVSDYASN